MQDLLDIDHLRSLGIDPHYFGLGMVQLKLDDQRRIHFWHPDFETTVDEEWHDHRYSFTSKVLAGSLTNETAIFRQDDEGVWLKMMVSCKADDHPSFVCRGNIVPTGTFTLNAGSSYDFPDHLFHRTCTEGAITVLDRGPTVKDFAHVIMPEEGSLTCPFSANKPLSRVWDMVAETIETTTGRPANPGYHLRAIAKGKLGEASKIVEEAAEFEEALEQGVDLMAILELADMMGAVEAYLAKHHPSLSLDDLMRMKDATKRAFANGRRS